MFKALLRKKMMPSSSSKPAGDDDLFDDIPDESPSTSSHTKKGDSRGPGKSSRASISKRDTKAAMSKTPRKKQTTPSNIIMEEVPEYSSHDTLVGDGQGIMQSIVPNTIDYANIPAESLLNIPPSAYFSDHEKERFDDFCIYVLKDGTYVIDNMDSPSTISLMNVRSRLPIKAFCQHIIVFNAPHGPSRSTDPIIFGVNEKYVNRGFDEFLKLYVIKSSKVGSDVFMVIATTKKDYAKILAKKFMEKVRNDSFILGSEKSWRDVNNPTRLVPYTQ